MATVFPRVRPGDLITAQQFNLLLDALEALASRVEKIEGEEPTAVRIDAFEPPGQQEVGRNVTIRGANFVVPMYDPVLGTLRNIIRINEVPIPVESYVFTSTGTSASSLTFRVPDTVLSGVGASGASFAVSVENENGRASRNYAFVRSTATQPSPTISEVRGPGSGTNLIIGQPVTVRGTNFAGNQTRVDLLFVEGTTEVVYPAASEQPIAVTVSSTEISFNFPDTRPRINVNLTGRDVSVRVSVTGAPQSAQADARVFPSG
ncbi:hypothetical protein [Sorangium sp. So ce128]|uniref:hypothetical protein n=1 Tax=Sorangium sp. So ce128 TaxID=3133281 RepID=UPI003F6006AA